ncbi:MAG: NifB/NifX family molybdenum-iron cluster-binding protein [Deltaproteobacteria bacterium]|nr:NifB/NifX family molybdenum-iron cluster-binding protein [Deltaproteobacteria bacterium]MBW2052303.1 NifB/NifX family molybdenum-iron cluster-binding protein [Deltaproteobacteria bacterium]MBW2139759.1 NifB/NifX family molybdenum-iron cluster-binding protein [Deltaproteobacteria bacterium]MBW2323004.1 NifB/NifX family molybdenum-iron cluster-binding protein [Deltaproteobacteria bacterium]
MAKIVVTCQGQSLDDKVDPRFGRAANFLVVDSETLEFQVLDNSATNSMAQGAGIQSAQTVANAGAEAVLTGFVGPKAFQALNAANIKIGQGLEGVTVREAVARFNAGEVEIASKPSREGHWR